MRYEHLEQVKVSLKVLSPLHIGAGKENMLRKKLLLFNTRSQTVSVPDLPRMIAYMTKKGQLQAFENYLMSNQSDMFQFLRSVKISTQEAQSFMAYNAACSEPVNTINELNAFIKEPSGKPYIPGSSIKGAVRTALLSTKMDDVACGEMMQEVRGNPRYSCASAAEHRLQTLPGGNEMLRDVMRGIAFSDCTPFEPDQLIVCRKQWQKVDGTTSGNALYLECIQPGATTDFTLTIDHAILPEADYPRVPDMLKAAMKAWFERNLSQYDSYFREPIPPEVQQCTETILRLGAGTGLQTKSLLSCLTGDIRKSTIDTMLKARHGKTYNPKSPNAPAPYCRKVVLHVKAYRPFGYCSLTFHK